MKRFKDFINEGLTDKMVSKSDEDVLKSLEKLSDNDKIRKIIEYRLDYDLLPRNKDGVCYYEGSLYCIDKQITELPNNFNVNGYFDCSENQLTELPDNLNIRKGLCCSYNQLTSLPDNLVVEGSLYCVENQLTILPDNLVVKDLGCSGNQLTSLPSGLVVEGDLICINNKVKLELPPDAKVGGKFYN